MTVRPVSACIAIGLALLPMPTLKLLEYTYPNCGDGLCLFWPALLILGSLIIATLTFVIRSAWRKEPLAGLRLVPLVLWGLQLVWAVM